MPKTNNLIKSQFDTMFLGELFMIKKSCKHEHKEHTIVYKKFNLKQFLVKLF